MKAREAAMLVALAGLWGASFLFMRIAAAAFGPVSLISARLVVATLFFLPVLRDASHRTALCEHWRPLLTNGLLSAAIPFSLLAYSTLSLTAGFTSLLNALTPITTALIAWLVWKQQLRRSQWLGLALGVAGVAILCWGKMTFRPGGTGWAIATAVTATLCYGLGGNLAKRSFTRLQPKVTSTGTLIAASLGLLLPGIALRPAIPPPPSAWLCVLLLGFLCTSVAYLLYFRLLQSVTATQVASVTFLVPMFSILWGAVFLGESLSVQMIVASAVILTGTALTNGLLRPPSPR